MTGSDASYKVIADLLTARTGQQLTESRLWRVPSALAGIFRERGISNVDQLVCLLGDTSDYRLASEVVEALLNNETYFFRDQASFTTLNEVVLPALARARADKRRLAVWSAGCSTGQEALSLAMLFARHPEKWSGWKIDILGTDVSGKAIAAARHGHYSQFEVQRGISVAHMLEFFTETDKLWQANSTIRSLVRFQQHNILDLPPPGHFDLILCRNVLLYFDTATRRRAFRRLRGALSPDGWLMLGAGETVIGQTDDFVPMGSSAALYRRNDAENDRTNALTNKAQGGTPPIIL